MRLTFGESSGRHDKLGVFRPFIGKSTYRKHPLHQVKQLVEATEVLRQNTVQLAGQGALLHPGR